MSLVEQTLKDLGRHEGCRLKVYKDTEGVWTIGVGHTGHNVVEGMAPISQDQSDRWLLMDYHEAEYDAKKLVSNYSSLSLARKSVLINMAFNLGYNRLKGFKKMLAAVESGDFSTAALEMLASKWAVQVKGRALELAARMASDTIPAHLRYTGDRRNGA